MSPMSSLSSMSAVHATCLPANAYTALRTPDELFQDISDCTSEHSNPHIAALLARIRIVLKQAIVIPSPPQDPPAEGPKPTPGTADSSSRGRPSRRQNLYGNLPGGAESVHRGPPQGLNQSFSFSNEDPVFQMLLPQVDHSTYDSAQRRADRRQAAQEAAEQARVEFSETEARKAAKQAEIDFDATEARDLQANREARQAAKAHEPAKREAADTGEASETLDCQAALEPSKAAQKEDEQITSVSDTNATLENEPKTASKAEQSTTSGAKKHAASDDSCIAKPKTDATRRVYTPTPSPKPKFPSRLSQTHSAYTDQEWEDLHENAKSTPSDTSNNALTTISNEVDQTLAHTESAAGTPGASILDIDTHDNIKDNTIDSTDDTVQESIEDLADNNDEDDIDNSINSQVSEDKDTSTSSAEVQSTFKAPSPPASWDSTYSSWHQSQESPDSQSQPSSSIAAASTPRIIKKAVGPASRRSTRAASTALTEASNVHALQPSTLGKRAHDSTADEVEPELKKIKPSQ